ncbi:transporter [Bacteroidota bacterium]
MRIYLSILLSFTFLNIIAQKNEAPELIGDRPDQTESAFIVSKGHFQFEDGFLFENETSEIQNISYSSMLLRYGLFENFELRFATEYNKTKSTGLSDITGFAPFAIGTKIHVNEEKGWIPQIAFLAHINIANTGAQEFLQDYHSSQIVLIFNHTINDSWSIGYSLGAEFPSDIDYTMGTYTLVSGFSISEKIGAFIEVYGDFSKYMYADNKVNGGVTYLLFPNLQLDFAGGFGLSQYSANNYFGLGIIYLFKI